MIWWWEHSGKSVTDDQTDRRTEKAIHRAAWWQLKMAGDTVSASHVHNDVSNQRKHDVSEWLTLCVRSVTVTQRWALGIKYNAEGSCFIFFPNRVLYLRVCYLGLLCTPMTVNGLLDTRSRTEVCLNWGTATKMRLSLLYWKLSYAYYIKFILPCPLHCNLDDSSFDGSYHINA